MKNLITVFLCFPVFAFGQAAGWQQSIKYNMDINLDVKTNLLTGRQNVSYSNNSPDTIRKLFVHLFFNAFQPNSMMDVSSRSTENLVIGKTRSGMNATDFDRRFKKRVVDLKPEEQGFCHVTKFLVNGKAQKITERETILEVELDKPLLPKSTLNYVVEFFEQVPKLSRRSGRDSDEGIRYSMGQWYPKLAEYDQEGWHADDYISREFYGVWGDFNVNITLDKAYKLGATGVLQNANEIGWGYDKEGSTLKTVAGQLRTWKFAAKNVHDFVWAADPDYKHITRKVKNGPLLHFIYKEDPAAEKVWQQNADTCAIIYPYMARTFGAYPYPCYSVIQGGGGGTEYPMATLVKDNSFETIVHEWCHSWYQMMMGTNENAYAWMDEGFTDYAEARVLAWLRKKDFFDDAQEYPAYFSMVKSGFNEPMSTPANFFITNYAYNINSYYKGAIFMRQLGYIVGEPTMDKILLAYYSKWRFKHPTPADFTRVAEKVSGMELKWYKDLMLYTTKNVDYAIDSLWQSNDSTLIRLKNLGDFPMPIDLAITFKDGTKAWHHIPVNLSFAAKKSDAPAVSPFTTHQPWGFVYPTYIITVPGKLLNVASVEIDPTGRLADIDRKNNKLTLNW
jgi:hypothetical protein